MNYQDIKIEDLETSPVLEGNFEDKIHIYQGHYIVRSKVNNDAPFYSSFSESRLLAKVEELGIGPKLYGIDKDGNSVCERLEGSLPFNGSDDELKQVAASLRILHASKIFMKTFEPFGRYRHYKNIARGDSKEVDKNNQPKEIFLNEDREKQLILELEPYYLKQKLLPCHNFLAKENLLFLDSKAKFVNYQFSGLNLKEFDLASLLIENDLLEKKESFLKEYYQQDYSSEKAKLVDLFIEFEYYLSYYYAKKRFYETKDASWEEIALKKKEKIESFH